MLSIVQYLMLEDQFRATFERVLETDCRLAVRAYAQRIRIQKSNDAWNRVSGEDQARLVQIMRGQS